MPVGSIFANNDIYQLVRNVLNKYLCIQTNLMSDTMNRHLFSALVFPALLAAMPLVSCGPKGAPTQLTVCNPLPVKFGDPFLLHASDGKFYLYGTSLDDGFEAFVSSDLTEWTPCGQVYKGADSASWNVSEFWAPEVYERDGRYYLFYSASARRQYTGDKENFQIGVAVADNPGGPFTDLHDGPLFASEYPVIDANVLFDEPSGKTYLYFSRCCSGHPVESEISVWARKEKLYDSIEESWIYGVELAPDFSGIVGEPRLLLAPPQSMSDRQAEWESRSVTAGEAGRRWTEDSYIFRHDSTYYMLYSANAYYGPHYAVGYATSRSPLGPFEKYAGNPVLSSRGNVTCTGHNMVIEMPSGELYTVYHARMADDPAERVVMIDHIAIDSAGVLSVDGPTTAPYDL